MASDTLAPTRARRPALSARLAAVIGLLLLAPFCAEYLIAYQGVLLNPLGLLAGVLVVAPLYGLPAILIRELARRADRGWPTILTLGAAFGLVQAGLIDQSLFNHASFGDGPFWQTLPALIPGVSIDASQFIAFIGGHIIWSFAAPIAVVEACAPRLANRPWLGRTGIVVVALLYLAGAAVFVNELVVKPGFHAGTARLIGVAVVVVALGVAAFLVGGRPRHRVGRAPRPWLVGAVALVLLSIDVLISDVRGWLGVAAAVLALALLGALLLRWSGGDGWGREHVLAAAGAALVLYALVSFGVDPQDASPTAKYTSSAVVLLGVLALLAWARHRLRRAGCRDAAGGDRPGVDALPPHSVP